MSKWEYCAVVGLRKPLSNRQLDPKYPAIWYFTPSGVVINEITGGKGLETKEIGRVIANLGEQGWEMVGCANVVEGGSNSTDSSHCLYFKRPIP